jgi:hypothetical protein
VRISISYTRCLLFRWREEEEKEKQEEEEEKRKKIKEAFTTPLETHFKKLNGYLRKKIICKYIFLRRVLYRPGIEPRASTVEDELYERYINSYLEHLNMAPDMALPSTCVT